MLWKIKIVENFNHILFFNYILSKDYQNKQSADIGIEKDTDIPDHTSEKKGKCTSLGVHL